MEFQNNLQELFFKPVTANNNDDICIEIVNNSLLPSRFYGEKSDIWNCYNSISLMIDALGLASARAQGLTKPITSGEKLKKNDHVIYLLVDFNKNVIIGMLKVGRKNLYLFDKNGDNKQYQPLCILDFYIHESQQRKGYGKKLYQYMLQNEHQTAEMIAIDRPSTKFLGFLNKHYNLIKTVKQINNFVIFEQFFDQKRFGSSQSVGNINNMNETNVSMTNMEPNNNSVNEEEVDRRNSNVISLNSMNVVIENLEELVFEQKQLDDPKQDGGSNSLISSGLLVNNNHVDNVNDNDNEKVVKSYDDVSDDGRSVRSGGRRSPCHLTEQGYVDLKFYHSPLW